MFKKIRKKFKSSFLYDLFINFKGEYKKSYSESFGEDLFVLYFFKNIKKGFYVDIGCNLPKSRSLTFLLYKKNWNGIKVDISKRSIDLNKIIRKRDINLNISVGNEEKTIDSFIFYNNCSMNTVDKKFKNFTEKSVKKKPEIIKINQKKLDTVLDNYNIKKIDYLNIDVEGYELKVLSGFNIKKYNPDLVSIEIHDKECPPLNNDIYKFFIDNKYNLISIYGWTYFFSKKVNKDIHFTQ
jgi:FkbM family methyltransferase|tara:strand:+ start:10929 stop:11645 length:717 start_codon:yes stop_codon:yes gene_type:complete